VSGFGVRIDVRREVKRAAILDVPLRRFFERALVVTVGRIQQAGNVPIDTGRLRADFGLGTPTTLVDRANPPSWAMAGTNLDYGRILHDDKQGRRFADGPSKGKRIKGWLNRPRDQAEAAIKKDLLKTLAHDMEKGWNG